MTSPRRAPIAKETSKVTIKSRLLFNFVDFLNYVAIIMETINPIRPQPIELRIPYNQAYDDVKCSSL